MDNDTAEELLQGVESTEPQGRRVAGAGSLEPSTHYFVDVPDVGESNYSAGEQHVAINPTFRAQLQIEEGRDISEFLALPELIPAKKRKRQQPLLDFIHSRILTSRVYITGMEQLLAKKEAIAAAAKKKKEKKDANKEQRQIDKEQL